MYGIDEDIFLSVPCVLSLSGVERSVVLDLSDEEKEKLYQSVKQLLELQKQLDV